MLDEESVRKSLGLRMSKFREEYKMMPEEGE
jgi:hypothetical protein